MVGTTTSGKTKLAADVARLGGGEVVNADALQLYRELGIGVAKPDASLRRLVPHHLFEEASVREPWSAGAYACRARQVIEEIWGRGRIPVLAGGTGLYVKAVILGLPDLPVSQPDVRRRVARLIDRHGIARAYRLLRHRDPGLALRLHGTDRQRISRGLEVSLGTGRALSELQRGAATPLDTGGVAVVGVRRTRADLAGRIARRIEEMWREGLLSEAKRLSEEGLRAAVEARKPIGYREAFAVLDGRIGIAEAKRLTARATLQLAKRQETWWRRRDVRFVDVAEGLEPDAAAVLDAIRFAKP